MAPNKKRTRADEFNDLVSSAPAKDFNPDDSDLGPTNSDDDSDAASEIDDSAGRDHYVDVGKAKLRGKGETALGPQYRGSKVSRGQAEEEEDEDGPFGFEDGREESSEEDEEMGEGSESESGDEEEEEEEEEGGRRAELRRIMAEGGGDEEDIEEDDHAEAPEVKPVVDGDSREELRRTMAEEQKTGTASIMQAAKADAEKGRAVKRQRTAFDSLLNTRIKLQKSLIATNTMVDMPANTLSKETSTAASAAETAAFNLWSTLTDFREELSAARTGSKRKHSQFTADTPIADLLTHQQSQEEASLPHRNATLRKWSEKARPQTALAQRSKLNNTTAQASIVDVLNEHLSDTSRLLTRAQTPRSCAPVQLAAKTPHDARIYDDADFYGLLLKELLEQKSADSVASASYSNSLDLSMQMRRDAKTKRQVDTKASKGRKLRYNVHEKLQNFMAPEDRRQWGDRQADELFAGLFGQRLGLAEETGDGEVDGEEAEGGDGLMLFSR